MMIMSKTNIIITWITFFYDNNDPELGCRILCLVMIMIMIMMVLMIINVMMIIRIIMMIII